MRSSAAFSRLWLARWKRAFRSPPFQNSSSKASVFDAARLSANIFRKICHHDQSESKSSNSITACTTTLAWATMETNDRSGCRFKSGSLGSKRGRAGRRIVSPPLSFGEQLAGGGRRNDSEVAVCEGSRDAATIGPLQEPLLDEKRFEHVLDGVALLADRRRPLVDAHRPPAELVEDALQKLAVHDVETRAVDIEHLQGGIGDRPRDMSGGANLGKIAHPAQKPVGDTRRAARAARDLDRALGLNGDLEQPGRARDNAGELLSGIELQPGDDAEAVAQRIGQHARARGRADQRERLQIELDAASAGPLADHDVDLEILERGIENFFDDRRQTVDLVDEQYVVRLEVGGQGCGAARGVQHPPGRM